MSTSAQLWDARALIGWMTRDAARGLLRASAACGSDGGVVDRLRAAHEAVDARPPWLPTPADAAVDRIPAQLAPYVEELMAHPGAAAIAAEGWTVRLVDLRRVVALQPLIFLAAADARTAATDPDDLEAIARVSLPLPAPVEVPVRFDQDRRAWILSSPNPNLRVTQSFGGEVEPGVIGFGFAVEIPPSMMQVVAFRDRLLLRDGYHRAYGFLQRGIATVPIFFRRVATFEEIAFASEALDRRAFLGDRPPLLADYLADDVSVALTVARQAKTVTIQAVEAFATMG